MDLMDIGRGFKSYRDGVETIRSDTLMLSFARDTLIPPQESERLVNAMKQNHQSVSFETHSSIFGHDAFLKEFAWLNPTIAKFLDKNSYT